MKRSASFERWQTQRPAQRVLVITTIPTPYNDALFKYLADQPGLEVRVLYCAFTESHREWELDRAKSYNYVVMKGHTFGRVCHLNLGVSKLIRAFEPDIAMLGGSYITPTLQLAIRTLRGRNIPWVYWGEELQFGPVSPTHRLLRSALRRPLRQAKGILAIGRRAVRSYQAIGVAASKIANFHYYPDAESFNLTADVRRLLRAEIRSTLAISDDVVVFLYCGQLIQRKGVDTLLRAAASLRGGPREVLVLLVGGGPERSSLLRLAESLGIAGKVRFAGFVQGPDLPAYYAAADVFVLPSHKEGWGVVVTEAMQAGLPVLASDRVNAAVDLIEDGKSGFVFRVGDAAALSHAMRRVCESSNLRAEMATNAAERAKCETSLVAAARLRLLINAVLTGDVDLRDA